MSLWLNWGQNLGLCTLLSSLWETFEMVEKNVLHDNMIDQQILMQREKLRFQERGWYNQPAGTYAA